MDNLTGTSNFLGIVASASLLSLSMPVTILANNNGDNNNSVFVKERLVLKSTTSGSSNIIIYSASKYLIQKAKEMNIEIPNRFSCFNTDNLLKLIDDKSLLVKFKNPIYEGGIMIEFYNNSIYNLVEIYNDKSIVYVTRNTDGTMKAWDLTEETFIETINREITT